jgi:hypothetical protein
MRVSEYTVIGIARDIIEEAVFEDEEGWDFDDQEVYDTF